MEKGKRRTVSCRLCSERGKINEGSEDYGISWLRYNLQVQPFTHLFLLQCEWMKGNQEKDGFTSKSRNRKWYHIKPVCTELRYDDCAFFDSGKSFMTVVMQLHLALMCLLMSRPHGAFYRSSVSVGEMSDFPKST